ncbi:hypothetical protein ONS95_002598 [Cadophora gregata]|uniref:uncharacterized protein n=1 Tax=Cadophora gregata TaxID=51156 RepID=UPI0026DAAD4C|nr:uncharacterized protein ONS95_002598 [Cadophora gregata]KAK0109929.1 hypothetical protein ONS95_002598 [Cadophora gregata]KAK0110442.1 hypothetical protein ONS96_002053 [Cadophora gregata f. sp. sojae]
MMISGWRISLVFAAIVSAFFIFSRQSLLIATDTTQQSSHDTVLENLKSNFQWSSVPQKFSVTSIKALPDPTPNSIPRIQHRFKAESKSEKDTRLFRLNLVKGNFTHAWKGYKKHGWLRDEVKPLSGDSHDPFGGWAATLVDSLDTLWIMGMKDEFQDAVNAIKQVDFSTCALDELNVFETTIRYLGGFLSAYHLSGNKYPILIQKAKELGDMLYKAFDTPNRLPIVRWKFKEAREGASQEAHDSVLVSEPGSLTLEFTRLSQVTGDPKYYDAVQRVMDLFDAQQDKTKLPGMWPVVINLKNSDVSDYGGFTIGGMADSVYEYLPKQHILLGGGTQ